MLDTALAGALFIGSLILLSHRGVGAARSGFGSAEIDFATVALTALSTIPLIAWRRSPLGAFVVTATASDLLVGIGHLIELPLGLTAALYFVAATRKRYNLWTKTTPVTVLALLISYLGAQTLGQRNLPGIVVFHTALVWAVAWFAGERTCLRNEQIAALRQHALDAEREVERERQLATAKERTQIARDLHDSVGHAISVIAVRAGAARLRHEQDPDRSLQALEMIEILARQTVAEIDQIVGTLRENNSMKGVVEGPPGLASLKTLLAYRSAAGLDVTFNVSGKERPLGATADQAVYRIFQEALTNAARHGAGSARIELSFEETAIELKVANPVRIDDQPLSAGHGLIGMRERAALLGGNLTIERTSGTFRVRARIPYGDRKLDACTNC